MTELSVLRIKTHLRISFRVKKIGNDDKTKYGTFYSHSETKATINKSDIDDVFELIYTTLCQTHKTFLRKDSGLIQSYIIMLLFQMTKSLLVAVI